MKKQLLRVSSLHNAMLCCTWLLLFILQRQQQPGGQGLVQASHHHVVSLDLRLLRRQLLALQFQTATTERESEWSEGDEGLLLEADSSAAATPR